MTKLCRFLIIGIFTFALVSACGINSAHQVTSQADKNPGENIRVVEHALGKAQVPINPQRVVVLQGGLDTVLSLGVTPVGSVRSDRGDHYLADRFEGIESVGSSESPNLESIVALKPDLILGTEWDKQIYEPLSQISPTVIAAVDTSGEWQEMFRKYAEALGKTDEAEQVIADYYARIEMFQSQMGDRLQQIEVSLLNIDPQETFKIYLEGSFSGTVVAETGLPRPPAQASADTPFALEISKELIQKADGDIIFVWRGGGNDNLAEETQGTLKRLEADPLWSKLNAVQQGQVYEVAYHWFGMGPIAANLVLDDLFKYLVDSPSQAAQ